MKQRLILLGLVLLLPACSENARLPQQMEVIAVLDEAVDAFFAISSEEDDVDISLQEAASFTREPGDTFIMLIRQDVVRSRERLDLQIDPSGTSATALYALSLTGKVIICEMTVNDDGSVSQNPIGEKPIDMHGEVSITATRTSQEERWQLDTLTGGLGQGGFAATVADWSYSPDPLVSGAEATAFAQLRVPDAADAFRVIARGRHLHPRSRLNDLGLGPDELAADGLYSGLLRVAEARSGQHVGLLQATNFTKTSSLEIDSAGNYLYPYTETLAFISAEVQ